MSEIVTQLSPTHRRAYTILRIFLFAGFIVVGLWITDKILFPTHILTFDFDSPDALKNDLVVEDANNKTLIHASAIGTFDTVKIILHTRHSAQNYDTTIRKGYQSVFLPFAQNTLQHGQPTLTAILAGLPSGTLMTYGAGIGVILPNQHIAPIISSEIFLAKGYSFDNVVDDATIDKSIYHKAKMFTLKSRHPDGTVIYFDDAQEYYIVADNHLYRLSDDDVAHVTASPYYNIIVAQKASRDTATQCQLQPSQIPWRHNQLHCLADSTQIAQFTGPDYAITVPIPQDNLQFAQVELSRARTFTNAWNSLSRIKSRLLLHYTQE